MGTAESWQPLDLTDDHPQLAGERESITVCVWYTCISFINCLQTTWNFGYNSGRCVRLPSGWWKHGCDWS